MRGTSLIQPGPARVVDCSNGMSTRRAVQPSRSLIRNGPRTGGRSGGTGASARYCYDRDSNRTQVTASSSTACGTATYTYNPANANSPGPDQLTSVGSTLYRYNGDGQLDCRGTTVTSCPSTADSFRWDGHSRLSGATVGSKSVCYRYDPTGALRSRVYDSSGASGCSTATSTMSYGFGGLFELDASRTVTTSYQDGPTGNLVSFSGLPTSGATASYLFYDGHGNLAAETSSTGTRTAWHSYDPFGVPLDTAPANQTSHRFTGRWNKNYDSTSSLVLMGARPYDPAIGRFYAVDPIEGGAFNNYDYAAQDPINSYDLDGTMVNFLDGGTLVDSSPSIHEAEDNCPTRSCEAHTSNHSLLTTKDLKTVGRVVLKTAGTYGLSCAINGGIAAAVSGGSGFVAGCALGVAETWGEKHAPEPVVVTIQLASVSHNSYKLIVESGFGQAYARALGGTVRLTV